MKIKMGLKLQSVCRLKDGSYLAYVKGKLLDPSRSTSKRKYFKKERVLVRVIDLKVKGFPPTRLITNVLDQTILAKELVVQYHQRWEIEMGYFEIKIEQCATRRGQAATVFRSKRSDLVYQELYAILIIYNLIRYKIWQAVEKEGLEPIMISFLDAKHWIIDVSNQLFGATSEQKQQILLYLLQMIAQSKIDRPRRKRRNPRVIKQRSSTFPLKKAQQQEEHFDLDKDLDIINTDKRLPVLVEKKKEENIDFIEKIAA